MSLLRGKIAHDARAALVDLSARFLRLKPAALPSASLSNGLAGVALVHATLDRVVPNAGHRARAEQTLRGAIERLTREPLPPGLYTGAAGIGWVVERLVAGGATGEDDPCAVFDEALAGALSVTEWAEPFDLVSGLVGVGVYALERMARAPAAAKHLLARVVNHLGATARRQRLGIAWWSDPMWIAEKLRRAENPDWDLGVAHGVPGVVALLGLVAVADVGGPTRAKVRALLDGAVVWLLAHELPASAEGSFGYFVGRGAHARAARVAWCYGDPGVAATLLVAARAAREPAWERAAVRIGLRAAARPEASAGVVDAGLCHGAAGVAQIFHRLFRTTGEERFADAARTWFARALASRAPGRGFAGFRTYSPDARPRWFSTADFLTGAGGIALALAAATTNEDPTWDRLLLLS